MAGDDDEYLHYVLALSASRIRGIGGPRAPPTTITDASLEEEEAEEEEEEEEDEED